LPKAVGYHASSGLFAASLGENLTRFSSETRVVEVLVQQLLDLVQNPGWITVYSPLRISRRTRKVLIRRVATGSQAGHRLRVTDQAARLDAAFNLAGDQQIVLIKKGFPNVKPKGGKRNVDSAAGERKLDCPGGVAELSSANLKGIQVLIASAERDLQDRVEFGQTRLFSDQQSASHRLLPQTCPFSTRNGPLSTAACA
jgi:hypothetical protein